VEETSFQLERHQANEQQSLKERQISDLLLAVTFHPRSRVKKKDEIGRIRRQGNHHINRYVTARM
jgi:hypothetical protein